jgi:rubrerythrin
MYNDFLELAGGNRNIADMIFEVVDWQYPASYVNSDLYDSGYGYCENCGYLFFIDEGNTCPNCKGSNQQTENEEQD